MVPRNRWGQVAPARRLSDAEVLAIRKEWASGVHYEDKPHERYGITWDYYTRVARRKVRSMVGDEPLERTDGVHSRVAKLTADDVRAIRREWDSGEVTRDDEPNKRFGVSWATYYKAATRRSWTKLED